MTLRTAACTLIGASPYSQSRYHNTPKQEKESPDDYEKRTWREKCHANAEGFIVMPPMGFKFGMSSTAKYLSEKIPGKRNATWTKHFEAGVLCMEPPVLPVKKESVGGEWYPMNADGKRGSGTRVWRCFPVIEAGWKATVEFAVVDDAITTKIFEKYLSEMGLLRGIGRFRPEVGGFYGRFTVDKVKWI